MKSPEDLLDLLTRLEEYMDNKADADYNNEHITPNKEMSFLSEIREAIDKIEKQGK